ncbi:MAG TPA: alkaline phosphatase family protein [Candidatus Phocaeicola gallistercoris]|nr:alkaline phosphatase family protein [Candidatus Phocaeicola gallistercoris]
MKERILTSLITAFVFATMQSQTSPIAPKLVIGLTIDQLRTDYMEAFSALYGERGFKRLLKEGCVYYNGEYDFINVDLSSSVAALYTGTTPYYNGILANRWMDRRSLRLVNSVSDPSYMGIYTSEFTSPQHLQVSTLSDELKVSTNGDAEIYSISPTREMAIFAAGHAANGAFWLNDETGKWCGSTYYGGFPEWISSYNDRDGLDFRIDNITWGPYLPVTSYQYVASEVKQLSFEHDFSDERADKYRKFKTSPYVNDEVNRLVNACFANTNIGKDNVPDLLTIGYYGGNYDGKSDREYAMEIQDAYVRLDNTIGDLLDLIDRKVGLKNTLIFVTSTGYIDSEPADSAQFKIPTGEFHIDRCGALLNMYLMAVYGQGQYVETYYDQQIYLNHKVIEEKELNLTEVLNRSADFIVQMSGVRSAYTSQRLLLGAWNPHIDKIRNNFNLNFSGDIYIEVMPGWSVIDEYYHMKKVIRDNYVSVPIIFFGYNVTPKTFYDPIKITAIAPTIAHFMRIRAPNAATVAPLITITK